MSNTVSIIIASYNRKEKLLRCLNSLKEQTYKYFEVIVIDDKSVTEVSSFLKIENYNFLITLVVNEKNGGRAVARNNGVKMANCKYILFTDDDCTFKNDYVELMYIAIKNKKGNVAGIAGRTKAMFNDIYNRYYELRGYGNPIFLGENNMAMSIVTANCIIKKRIFEEVNGFDDTLVIGGEDTDLFYRVIETKNDFYFEEKAILYHDFETGVKAMSDMAFRYGRSSADIEGVLPHNNKAYTNAPKKVWKKISPVNLYAKYTMFRKYKIFFLSGMFFDLILSFYFFKGYKMQKRRK